MTEKSYKQFLVESLSAYTVISEHILITTRALKENLASLAAHFEVSNSVLGWILNKLLRAVIGRTEQNDVITSKMKTLGPSRFRSQAK